MQEATHRDTQIELLNQRIKAIGLTQSSIAKDLGVSQGQVSRVLSGQSNKRSKLFDKICIYTYTRAKGVNCETVRANEDLINALTDVWDGSPAHAKALSTIIRSLALLAPPGTSRLEDRNG